MGLSVGSNWWDNLQMGVGQLSDPYGSLSPGNAGGAFNNSMISLGTGMLANSRARPMEAFGSAWKSAQQEGQQNSMNKLNAQNLMLGMDKTKKDMAWQGTERQNELDDRGEKEENKRRAAAFVEEALKQPRDDIPMENYGKARFWMAAGDPIKAYEALTGEAGQSEAGLNLTYWTDENGKLRGGQTLKGGGLKEIPLPEGGEWAPGVGYLDQGPNFLPYNKRGGIMPGAQSVPKDLAGAAAQTELGKDRGGAAALHASLSSKMPGLQRVIGELGILADQATYTRAGQAYNTVRKELGISPTDAAVARAKYIAMVDNQVLPMLRDTFGAQFTVVEGESLRATLGDPNKTPEEKKAVLNAFIEQKVRNIEASAQQGGVAPAQPPPVPQSQPDFSTMSDQELEAIINGP